MKRFLIEPVWTESKSPTRLPVTVRSTRLIVPPAPRFEAMVYASLFLAAVLSLANLFSGMVHLTADSPRIAATFFKPPQDSSFASQPMQALTNVTGAGNVKPLNKAPLPAGGPATDDCKAKKPTPG
ncbi:MAG: hypothetical protein AB1813_29025 [Verrucomicrobiota bacterium]